MAKTKTDYWELLRDPRWQRKRLEIMQRAGFSCEKCEDNEHTLNVHHSYYERDMMPWDYPDDSLFCLCEPCHKHMQEIMTRMKRRMGQLLLLDHETLLGVALGLPSSAMDHHEPIQVSTIGIAIGVGLVYGLSEREVVELAGKDGIVTIPQLRQFAKEKKSRQANQS